MRNILVSFISTFTLVFYGGSHINKNDYKPILDQLPHNIVFKDSNLNSALDICFNKTEKQSKILIGHSFGGYYALNDYLKYPDNVKGIILLNSHTNSARKALYPGVDYRKLHTPILTILGKKDQRLSLNYGLHDMWQSQENNKGNTFYIVDDDYDHFNTYNQYANYTAKIMNSFIANIEMKNKKFDKYGFKKYLKVNKYDYTTEKLVPKLISFNKPLNMLDGLFKLILPDYFYDWCHNVLFLNTLPTKWSNTMFTDYTDSILIKTYNYQDNLNDTYIKSFYDSSINCNTTKIVSINLPSTLVGLYRWLLCIPTIKISNNIYTVYYYKLDMKDANVMPNIKNMTYYKLPHPKKLILKKLKKIKF